MSVIKRLVTLLLSLVLVFGLSIDTAVARPPDCTKKPNHPQCVVPTPTPNPTPTPTPTAVPTPTPSPTLTPTPTPTPTPGPTPTPAPTPTPTATPTPTPVPVGWSAQYYSNTTLSGTPTRIEIVPNVNFDYGSGAPTGLPGDNFSTRFTRTFALSGSYRFTVSHNDGARVRIDGTLVYDVWVDGSYTNTFDRVLSSGSHTFVVEQYEGTGTARIQFSWAAVAPPTPTPVPTPTPTPTPPGTDPWSTPFGTRPASGALSYNGNCPSVIENKTFRDLGANVIAIKIQNCSNVTIRANDFINVSEGVYAVDSSNINLIDNRYQNITGPYERVGLNRANLVQFNRVNGGLIDHNKGKCGDTEDVISVYDSDNIIVEDNHIEGSYVNTTDCLAWRSNSGTGAIMGDGQGSGNIIRRNIFVNMGQVGIGIAGGSNNRIEDNIVIGQRRSNPNSNVGVYVIAYSPPCSNNFVINNRVHNINSAGLSNGFYNPGSCSNTTVTGNNWNDTTLNIENYRVGL